MLLSCRDADLTMPMIEQTVKMPSPGLVCPKRMRPGCMDLNAMKLVGIVALLAASICFAQDSGDFKPPDVERSGCAVSQGRQQLTRADRVQGARRDEGAAQFLERSQGGHGEAGGKHCILWRKHVGQYSGIAARYSDGGKMRHRMACMGRSACGPLEDRTSKQTVLQWR